MLVHTNGRAVEVEARPADPFEATLKLFRGLRLLWDYLDEAAREVEHYNNGHPICIEKCGLCCQRSVPVVSRLEVEYIVGYLPTTTQVNEVRRRALDWLKTPRLDLQGQTAGRGAAMLERGPCPFLGEGAKCLMHSIRPLSCRGYGATTPQDVWCPRPLIGIETANARHSVAKDTPLGTKIAGVLGGTWKAMHYFGREDLAVVGFLPRLVAEATSSQEVRRLRELGQVQDAKMAEGRWVKPDIFGESRYAR